MQKIFSKLFDLKSIVNTLSVLILAFGAAYSQIDRVVDSAVERFYMEVNEPFFKYAKHDLLKQLEKLQKDPEDIKRQDILKFTSLCDDSKFRQYINLQNSLVRRDLNIACEQVTELYGG